VGKFPYTRVLQFNFEDALVREASRIKGSDVVALARRIHANTIVVFARDAWGRAYYDSRVARKHPKLGARDFLRELVEEAGKHGIRVIAMIGHTANPELYKRHPEWAQRKADGSVIAMDADPPESQGPMRWPLMCLSSPFLDVVVREAEEVLGYGVDGIFLDSFRYMPDAERACFCRYCRERYRREKGSELPEEPDWDSAAYRESFLWRYEVNVAGLRRVYEAAKARRRDAVLVYNSHPLGWRGRANRIVELARKYVDLVFAECSEADYQPPGFIAEMVKLSIAVSGGKPVWASRNSFHTCLTTTSTTPVAVRQGLREAFVAGGYPLYLVFSTAYAQGSDVEHGVTQVFREVETLEEYMEGAEPVRYAAVLFSNRSRDWGGRDRPDYVTDSFRGFYYALAWSRVPVTYICDTDLDNGSLEGFRVLVLANAWSVSSRGARSVRDFVARGRGLVATYLSSIMDEEGDLREEFILSDVLGVEYGGVMKLPWSYVRVAARHRVTAGFGKGHLVLWGDFDRNFIDARVPQGISFHARVKPRERSRPLAYVVDPLSEFGYEYENGRSPPPAGATTSNPAVVVREDANVVYFTGQLGRLYWRTGMPDLEALILNAVAWAGGRPPLEVKGPGLLQVEAYKRSGQLIVHLLNLTFEGRIIVRGNTAFARDWASTAESVHPPRRVVPLHGLEVIVRGFEVKNVHSPLTGRRYKVVGEEGEYRMKVPILNEYEVLVLDLR